jgi:hypothetical protein
MEKDIRINVSFCTHRKRRKLYAVLGAQGVLSLIDLWVSTAVNRPRGILSGMNEGEIALDAQWPGDPKEFCKVLVEVGFLDRDGDGTYSIHNWKTRNPWIYFSEERSRQAREAIAKRWAKKPKDFENEKEEELQGDNTDRITERNTPFPSPLPKKRNTLAHLFDRQGRGLFEKFWKAYPKKRSKGQAEKTWKKINPDENLLEKILSAIERGKKSAQWAKNEGQFIPYPATWLNAKGWEDQMEERLKSTW